MAAPKTSIELLPQEEWQKGSLGKLLKWVLTIGRHIVIVTELVVILAFLSRFKLDRDLSDLGESIKQKQMVVESSSEFEKRFRFLQQQLDAIENLKKSRLETAITELASLLPVDVKLSEFDIKNNQVSLTATSLSESGLATFLTNLKNSTRFENLTLTQVSSEVEKEVGINFQLQGDLSLKPKK